MEASFDISLYPLHEDFEKPIKDFIRKLRASGFSIIETPLSTQVYGDFTKIMEWLTENLDETLQQEDHCVVTIKIVKGNRKNYKPFKS